MRIKFKGEIGLLKDAYAIDRNSTAVREALLKGLLYYFDHASHEWSAGIILRGMDGATLDQCNEITSEVALARELDRECAYALSIYEFESKLKQYQGLISDRANPQIPSDGHEL